MGEPNVWLMIIGDSGVGKTSLWKHIQERGQPSALPSVTLGVDFAIVYRGTEALEGLDARVTLVDVPGTHHHAPILPGMYRRSDGILLMYDMSRRQTFTALSTRWNKEMRQHIRDHVQFTVIGNKSDLPPSQRQVSQEEGLAFAEHIGAKAFFEISALSWTLADLQKPLDELTLRVLRNPGYSFKQAEQVKLREERRQLTQRHQETQGNCCSSS